MTWIKFTEILFITMGPLLLSGCNQIPVKDEIFYGNKGMMGAIEFHTLTTGQRKISFEEWMQLLRSKPLICSSVDTFGDAKAFYEKVCSVCNCCSYETTAAAETFFSNIKASQKN